MARWQSPARLVGPSQGVYIQASAIAALEAANAAFVEAGLDPLRRRALAAQPATSTIEILVSALRYCVPTGILRLNLRQQGEAVTSTPTDGYARWWGGGGVAAGRLLRPVVRLTGGGVT